MEEIWIDVKDFIGLYQVSNFGRVRSFDRIDSLGRLRKGTILKPLKYKNGYLFVILFNNSERKQITVHRLVAEAFIPNPDNLDEINHKDEDKTNNRVENLEWCTHLYNCNYGTRNKRASVNKINNLEFSKPVVQYTLDGEFVNEFPSINEIERQLGYNHSNITSCLSGRTRTSYGFVWKHKDYKKVI